MSPKITIKEKYILVEPEKGTDYREIQRGVARLFYSDKIPSKNRIWVFNEGPEAFSDDDLLKLKAVIKDNYPGATNVNKTAIVVSSDCNYLWQTHLLELPTAFRKHLRCSLTLRMLRIGYWSN